MYGEEAAIHEQPSPAAHQRCRSYENFKYAKGSGDAQGLCDRFRPHLRYPEGWHYLRAGVQRQYEVGDEYQDAVDSAGIEGDPLQLPTDTEISEKLRSKIIAQIAEP